MQAQGWQQEIITQVSSLATFELYVATTIVSYVALRYALFFFPVEAVLNIFKKERQWAPAAGN